MDQGNPTTMHKNTVRMTLRGALCAAAMTMILSACSQTEVTELNCVRVADDQLAAPGEQVAETVVCDRRRYRLVFADEFHEPEVVKDETW